MGQHRRARSLRRRLAAWAGARAAPPLAAAGAAPARLAARLAEGSARNRAGAEPEPRTEAQVAGIQARERELGARAALLAAALDTMDQGLVMIGGDGVVAVSNPRAG